MRNIHKYLILTVILSLLPMSAGADVNADESKPPLLLLAVSGLCPDINAKNSSCPGDINVIKQLIESGANVNVIEKETGRTPLHYAVSTQNADIIKLLLDSGAGASVNVIANYSIICSEASNCKELDQSSYENIEATAKMETPLSIAIAKGKLDTTRLLLDAGADSNAVVKFSFSYSSGDFKSCIVHTPLSIAIDIGSVDAVKLLLDAGADAKTILSVGSDLEHDTPIYKAVKNYAQNKHYNEGLDKDALILNELFAHYNAIEIFDQVELCAYDPPTPEKAKWLAANIIDRNKNIDIYKRTKSYIDSIEQIYSKLNHTEHYRYMRSICAKNIVNLHNISDQLPYIYDFCGGDYAAFAGGVCLDTPKQVVKGMTTNCPSYPWSNVEQPSTTLTTFANCLSEFQIVKDDYVTSSEYFEERIQKYLDTNVKQIKEIRKDIESVRKDIKKANQKAAQNFIYWHSPRGKCEALCNKEYKKNTKSWKTCMDVCKDKRSDILK